MFVVSGSMALVAIALYGGVFVYMHRRPTVLAEPASGLARWSREAHDSQTGFAPDLEPIRLADVAPEDPIARGT
jgi:hypothetical protein